MGKHDEKHNPEPARQPAKTARSRSARPSGSSGGLTLRILRILAVLAWIAAIFMVVKAVITVRQSKEGGESESPVPTAAAAVETEAQSNAPIGEVEVDTGMLSTTVTIPAEYIGEMTQEQLDADVSNGTYKSATLNSDGSVTYVMSRAQHNDVVTATANSIRASIDELLASGEYPNITSVGANRDFTEFNVKVNSSELTLSEEVMTMNLYLYGGMYNAFRGTSVDNICVRFVNDATGEVVEEANSRDMET